MREHITAHEEWAATCRVLEAAIRQRVEHRVTRQSGDAHDVAFAADRALDADLRLKAARAARNGHQQAALMYGIASLVDAQTPAPGAATVDRRVVDEAPDAVGLPRSPRPGP